MEGGIVLKVFGNSDYVGALQELKKNWRSERRGQCEVAEEGEDRLEVIFTLWFFLGIWKMDANVAMIMEFMRSRSYIYIIYI